MRQRSPAAGKYPPTKNYVPLFDKKAGSSFSSTSHIEGNASAKNSQVIAFHSSSKWKTHFEASKSSNKLMVIDFSASWCGPCRIIEPVLKDLASKYTNVEFVKIDVDELHDVAVEFKVHAMPTFVLIKEGAQVDKIVGANKEELLTKIEMHKV